MKQSDNNTKIFINPSGFIEQHFFGDLEPEAIIDGLKKLKNHAKNLESKNQPVLILEDVTKLKKIEFLSPKMAGVRKLAAKTMKDIDFERAAIYGSLRIQVIVSTLALVTGKRDKLQVFDTRTAALKWLLNKK
jgi:hypothetical protein